MELDWKKNLGNTDRVIRLVIGIILIGLVLMKTITGWWVVATIVLGVSQLIEAALGY